MRYTPFSFALLAVLVLSANSISSTIIQQTEAGVAAIPGLGTIKGPFSINQPVQVEGPIVVNDGIPISITTTVIGPSGTPVTTIISVTGTIIISGQIFVSELNINGIKNLSSCPDHSQIGPSAPPVAASIYQARIATIVDPTTYNCKNSPINAMNRTLQTLIKNETDFLKQTVANVYTLYTIQIDNAGKVAREVKCLEDRLSQYMSQCHGDPQADKLEAEISEFKSILCKTDIQYQALWNSRAAAESKQYTYTPGACEINSKGPKDPLFTNWKDMCVIKRDA